MFITRKRHERQLAARAEDMSAEVNDRDSYAAVAARRVPAGIGNDVDQLRQKGGW